VREPSSIMDVAEGQMRLDADSPDARFRARVLESRTTRALLLILNAASSAQCINTWKRAHRFAQGPRPVATRSETATPCETARSEQTLGRLHQ
jgi:hypothetical protein